jgi:hypothetical protein
LLTTTTDGRAGKSFLKSGHRVDGFAKVDFFLVGWVLNCAEERFVVRREAGAA